MKALLTGRAVLSRRHRESCYQAKSSALPPEEAQKQTVTIALHSGHRKSTRLAFLLGFLRLTFTLGESLNQRNTAISQLQPRTLVSLVKPHLWAKTCSTRPPSGPGRNRAGAQRPLSPAPTSQGGEMWGLVALHMPYCICAEGPEVLWADTTVKYHPTLDVLRLSHATAD